MEHIEQSIKALQGRIAEHERHVVRLKTAVNELCEVAGVPNKYSAADLQEGNSNTVFNIRSDQFHARPMATVIREYLTLRRNADMGPATQQEIYDAMIEGGYEFNTKTDRVAKISLGNTLTKNVVFYKLPNKKWGMAEWYPKAKTSQAKTVEGDQPDSSEEGDQPPEEAEEI